ncbi:MAG TPA: hypothetical protein VMA36_04795 [Candidatus Limnocylindria bacterium]|nr:hypothetical protein [Candidatus Limnocylindria bacterium]
MLALILAAAVPAGAQPATTRVVTYRPAIPPGNPEPGQCWTTSIATNRPDAYRCLRGNEIFDPCFAARANLVVCDPNPALGRRGFALVLTRPLPTATPPPGPVEPWMVQLTDGSVCTPFTGTRTMIDGRIIAYGCAKRDARVGENGPWTGLLEQTMTTGRVWRVRKAVYSAGPDGRAKGTITTATIAAVWR